MVNDRFNQGIAYDLIMQQIKDANTQSGQGQEREESRVPIPHVDLSTGLVSYDCSPLDS